MTNISDLPPELFFQVLSYLPLPTLQKVQTVCKGWHKQIQDNEAFIYRHTALLHGFIPSLEVSLDEAKSAGSGVYLQKVTSWPSFCKAEWLLAQNWMGKGDAAIGIFSSKQYDVHRIKVDAKRGLLITTHQEGGLVVRDLQNDKVLWSLPYPYVRKYAHCEYENGFLIFDRVGMEKEVWRLASEYDEDAARPQPDQLAIEALPICRFPPSKGTFRPWARLNPGGITHAYRFVYPTLLVGGYERAYLFDVTTPTTPPTIVDNIQNGADAGDTEPICYVELSLTHILVCVGRHLRLFDRETRRIAYNIPCTHDLFEKVIVFRPPPAHGLGEVYVQRALPSYEETAVPVDMRLFRAVHVSRDGKTMVAMIADGRLVFFNDVPGLIKEPHKLAEHILVTLPKKAVNPLLASTAPLYSPFQEVLAGIYLAFEHGHVGFVTTNGIFAFHIDATKNLYLDANRLKSIYDEANKDASEKIAQSAFPHIHCSKFTLPGERRNGAQVTCLQMTETKMFFTWHPDDWTPDMRKRRPVAGTLVHDDETPIVEGNNEPLVVEGDNEPLVVDADDGADEGGAGNVHLIGADEEEPEQLDVDMVIDEDDDAGPEYEVVDWNEGPPPLAAIVACISFEPTEKKTKSAT